MLPVSSQSAANVLALRKAAPAATSYVKHKSSSSELVYPNKHKESGKSSSTDEHAKEEDNRKEYQLDPLDFLKKQSRDHDDEDQHEESDEDDEPKSSKYKISNLISLLDKYNIKLQTIFTYKKRVMMIQIYQDGFSYFVYVPSKYEMYIDRSLGIACYDMNDDDEEEQEEQETLFYSKLPIVTLRRAKKAKIKGLARFLPLVSESPIKIMYVTNYFVCYISRHNEVDSMIMLSPFTTSGYFYITDLEFFFKTTSKMPEELTRFEQAFNEAVYNRLTVEIDQARQTLAKATKLVNDIQPKAEKKHFEKVIHKLKKYAIDDKHERKAMKMMVQARNSNLNKMFQIENVTYVMKEFK